jgi:Flp pilus assembly protein TadD
MRQICPAISLCVLAFALGGCQTTQHIPMIEPPPAVSEGEKLERSRSLYLSVIEELIQNGQAHAALAHLDEYERSYGPGPAPQRLRADAWFVLGDMTKAEAGYRSVLKGAQSGYGKHGLGRIAASRGDWTLAQQDFATAVGDRPTNPRFLNDLGCSLFRLGRLEEAEFALRKAHELAPRDEEIVDNILMLLAKSDGAARLDDVFSDVSDSAGRADLHARLLAYAGREQRSPAP